jgi:DNA-directed RNA polymerase specialized sigma subunit
MDEKTKKIIISEYKKGKSSLQIVKIVNLSKQTILKVLNKDII